MTIRFTVMIVMLLGTVTAHARPSVNLPKTFAELTKISLENIAPAERDRRMEAVLQPVQGDVEKIGLSHLSDGDVKEYFDIEHLAAAYILKPRYAVGMRGAVDEMVRRKLDVTQQQPALVKIYVAARMLDDATEYAALVNDSRVSLPRFDDEAFSTSAHPTLWYVSGDASDVLRYSFPLDEGVRVVVSGHPWCHFSRNAAKDIEANAKVAALMERYAIWVVPQHPMPNFTDIAQWNMQHPRLRMRIAYRAEEWRDITSWATPIFYFFKDGRLVDSITGWQNAKQSDRLLAAFHTVGVD
jgi:hypothetical protein